MQKTQKTQKQELKNITIGAMLEETARKFPKVQAVKYIEMEFNKTWQEFDEKVDRIARGLLYMGFKKGDHIAIWATNMPQWLTLFYATAKIGVAVVTVNTNYKEKELEYVLKHSDSKALFICDQLKDIDCEKAIYSLCPEIPESDECDKWNWNSKKFPKLRMVVSFDNHYEKMFHWNEIEVLGTLVPDWQYEKAKSKVQPDDVINIQYTSGTTGFPKGVMLTHNNLVNNGQAIGDNMNLTEKDRMCIPVTFFHCFGLVLSILAATTHGTTMLPLLWFTPMKVMHIIEYEKCTVVNGVPTMFISMFAHRDFEKYDYSTMRTGIMAGANCPEQLMREVADRMNMKEIVSVFGQTEASPGCTMTNVGDTLDRRVGTVGTAFPHVEIKIVDPETGKTLGPNMQGELCARGYNVMKGYYNDPEKTGEAIDSDGWLHTGDLAEVDAHGYYKITGRIKDMIIRGGENISPKEIEDVIRAYDGVKDVAVVAAPSEKYGEEVCAVIIPADGAKLVRDEIKTYVEKNLARHKVPSYIEFAAEFPMTASGKIQKFIMKDMIKSKVENGELE
jgi:fatty-acyl-CoA synthase